MTIVVCILMALYLAMMVYLMIGWRRAHNQVVVSPSNFTSGVSLSVLIPFRNESQNLPTLLEDLLGMEGPIASLHITVIDDHSSDKTVEVIQPYLDSALSIYLVSNEGEGKIAALRTGLAQVNTEHVITLDADIRLDSEWLVSIMATLHADVDMCILPVLGTTDKSLSSRYAQLDFMSLIGTTFAMAAHGRPVMANGAQLMAKTVSLKWDEGIVSGDDVFALHRIKKAGGRISYALQEKLVASTAMPSTWREVFSQRLRWASKAGQYKDSDTLILGWLVLAVNVVLWVLFCLSVNAHSLRFLFLGMLITKAIIDFIFLASVMRWFGQLKRLWFFPIAFYIGFFQYPLVFIVGQMKGFTWKHRHYGR